MSRWHPEHAHRMRPPAALHKPPVKVHHLDRPQTTSSQCAESKPPSLILPDVAVKSDSDRYAAARHGHWYGQRLTSLQPVRVRKCASIAKSPHRRNRNKKRVDMYSGI